MSTIRFRIIENQKEGNYNIQIRNFFRVWQYLPLAHAPYSGQKEEYTTRESAMNNLKFRAAKIRRNNTFIEYPGLKIS